MGHARIFLACALLGAASAGCSAESSAEDLDTTEDGVSSVASAVGYVLDDVPGQKAGPHCTGTLVAPNVVLTAAHCILSPKEAELVYGPSAARYGLGLWAWVAKRPSLYRFGTRIAMHVMGYYARKTGKFHAMPFASGWLVSRGARGSHTPVPPAGAGCCVCCASSVPGNTCYWAVLLARGVG